VKEPTDTGRSDLLPKKGQKEVELQSVSFGEPKEESTEAARLVAPH
jgi:hypothetical protein